MIKDLFANLAEKLLNLLPDTYDKNSNSRLGRLIQIITAELEEIQETKEEIYTNIDIDQAEGVYLDRIGRNVGEPRGQMNDTIYRLAIKARIQQNFSPGDVDSLIEYISTILQINRDEVEIHEPYWGSFYYSNTVDESELDSTRGYDNGLYGEVDAEPAFFEIFVPFGALNDSGIPAQTFIDIIAQLKAVGVRIVLDYPGTFLYSETETQSELDSENGYDNGVYGGYYDPS